MLTGWAAFPRALYVRWQQPLVFRHKTHSEKAGITQCDKLPCHRGHAWVRQEGDGTLTVGLDELAGHLIGHPDSVQWPVQNCAIESNGIAWRMMKNGHETRVRAPVYGTVVSTGGAENGRYLRLRPRGPVDLRHLLRGAEVPGSLSTELDRLQLQFSASNAKPALADGGTLRPELSMPCRRRTGTRCSQRPSWMPDFPAQCDIS